MIFFSMQSRLTNLTMFTFFRTLQKGNAKLMSKFSRFIKKIVLPDKMDKERRKKILSEGIIETWAGDEQERRAKEAREIAKKTYNRIRSSKTSLEV